jgi:hypothetical protein
VVLQLNATVPAGALAELRIARFAAATAADVVVAERAAGVVSAGGAFVGEPAAAAAGVMAGAVDAAGRVCLQLGSGVFEFTARTG